MRELDEWTQVKGLLSEAHDWSDLYSHSPKPSFDLSCNRAWYALFLALKTIQKLRPKDG